MVALINLRLRNTITSKLCNSESMQSSAMSQCVYVTLEVTEISQAWKDQLVKLRANNPRLE